MRPAHMKQTLTLIPLALLAACSPDTNHNANQPSGPDASLNRVADDKISFEPPFEHHVEPNPTQGGSCEFVEKPPSERPEGLVSASNADSNVIFLQREGGPLWSSASRDIGIAELPAGETIVAVRYNMPDLWIIAKDGGGSLYASKDMLRCPPLDGSS